QQGSFYAFFSMFPSGMVSHGLPFAWSLVVGIVK
ncbi:MAG: hypothetical protein AVDCRST_MAG93-8782, partial [uncultured Chloroflexia bacterium]